MKHEWIVRAIGILMIVAGVVIRYVIARRRFNRRAMTGAEGFRSFESFSLTRVIERLCKLIAIVILLAGLVVLISTLAR